MLPVEQELLSLLEHPSSLPGFSGVHVIRTLVFCVIICTSLFVILRCVCVCVRAIFEVSVCFLTCGVVVRIVDMSGIVDRHIFFRNYQELVFNIQ